LRPAVELASMLRTHGIGRRELPKHPRSLEALSAEQGDSMEITNDAGLSALLQSTEEERLCTGFGFTEGPIWVADQRYLLFSDIPGSKIYRWRPGSDDAEVYRAPSRHSNGLTLDAEGRLLACEHSGRQVSRAVLDQPEATLVDTYKGQRFNSPNDIVVHNSGSIFFTDPTYGLLRRPEGKPFGDPDAEREIELQGAYRLDPDGSLTLVVDDFTQPNGLAFSPDESVLYIGDSQDGFVRRFDVTSALALAGGEMFVDMSGDERRGNPDGMKLDEEGRLWTTGAGGVWVITAAGEVLGQFETAEHAANLTFGGDDFSSLFLTAATSVYRVETNVRGVVPGSR
jgi:gluconolactonase